MASEETRDFYQPDMAHENNAQIESDDDDFEDDGPHIEWDASEYIHHAKGPGWVVGIVIIAVTLVALALWQQAWTFAVVIIVMAIAMGIFAFRPPRVLHYALGDHGLSVSGRSYDLRQFRAFGIIGEGAFFTITLVPARRFAPAVNVFFAEQDGDKIVTALSKHLPLEQIHPDLLDRFMRYLRF